MFTPRHPRTRPKLAMVEEAEKALDIDALMAEALAGGPPPAAFPKTFRTATLGGHYER